VKRWLRRLWSLLVAVGLMVSLLGLVASRTAEGAMVFLGN
jgi:hypothetical protein